MDSNVEAAVEIFAMDERRRLFFPRIWKYPKSNVDSVVASAFERKSVLQQILIPGGHSDIGHPYGVNCIANVSLLTMIERLHALTSTAFDTDFLQNLLNETTVRALELNITREGIRAFSKKRTVPVSGSTEIHPLYFSLAGKMVYVDGQKVRYSHRSVAKDIHRRYIFDIDQLFGVGSSEKVKAAVEDGASQIFPSNLLLFKELAMRGASKVIAKVGKFIASYFY